ncbi:unnamed protein product, partial [Brassica oleracea var. botrytis]
MEQSKTESSTVLRAQREANITTKDHEPRGELEVEKEKEQIRSQSNVPEIANHGLAPDLEKETTEVTERQKKDKENEDVDLDISIDEYAEMAMNEEMIDAEAARTSKFSRVVAMSSAAAAAKKASVSHPPINESSVDVVPTVEVALAEAGSPVSDTVAPISVSQPSNGSDCNNSTPMGGSSPTAEPLATGTGSITQSESTEVHPSAL